MINIFSSLRDELAAGRHAVLAVVTATWGSAPRGVGSLMLVRTDGTFEGSVSGGCVEGTVIAEAHALLGSDTSSKQLEFSVSNDDAFAVGLACGGTIRVSLFVLAPQDMPGIANALDAIAARQQGELSLTYGTGTTSFASIARATLVDDDATLHLPVRPRLRLDIIGAVHIAQALAPMASGCGFDVTVIDPRSGFTEGRTFEGAVVINDWPDEYLKNHPLDSHAALVTLTHDPKLDDAALLPALHGETLYIGCLGSRKTHTSRLERLRQAGIDDTALARIHGPAGLDIGASNPAEIAVSILAEIIAVMRKGDADVL
jgi:xanthine dehydrogenase accessory factor